MRKLMATKERERAEQSLSATAPESPMATVVA